MKQRMEAIGIETYYQFSKLTGISMSVSKRLWDGSQKPTGSQKSLIVYMEAHYRLTGRASVYEAISVE